MRSVHRQHPPIFRDVLLARHHDADMKPSFPTTYTYGVNSAPAQLARAIAVREAGPTPRPSAVQQVALRERFDAMYFTDESRL